MSSPNGSDVGVLIPEPHIFKVGGEELRLQVLPIKRLLGVIQYIQGNADLIDKAAGIFAPEEGEGITVVGFLEGEVYRRLNGLLRLLFDKATAAKLTDEWCLDHLSNAHYAAIITKAIQQNQLEGLFLRAKEYLGSKLGAYLRQAISQEPAQKA